MNRMFQIACSLISLCGYAQNGIDRFEVDSLQLYSKDIVTYDFYLDKPFQGLYFDNIVYLDRPNIIVRIINNTTDTIVNRYKERDSRIYWLRQNGSFESLAPGEKMVLRGAWVDAQPMGSFNSPIRLSYLIEDSLHQNRINVWGSVYPHKDSISQGVNMNLFSDNLHVDEDKDVIEIEDNSKNETNSNDLYYFNSIGKRIKIGAQYKGIYYMKRTTFDTQQMFQYSNSSKEYLDSLSTLLKPLNAKIKYGLDGFIIECELNKLMLLKKKLGDRPLYQLVEERRYLEDIFIITFNANVSEEKVKEIFKAMKIDKYRFENSQRVFIYLSNSPIDNNNKITDQLATLKEIKRIQQQTIRFPIEMD